MPEPRLLVIDVCTEAASFICISAHIPYGKESHSWIAEQHPSLVKITRDRPVILLVDANLQISHAFAEVSGGFGARKSSPQSQAFLEMLQEMRMAIPSTFECSVSDSSLEAQATYFHKEEGLTPVRIDYLAFTCEFHVIDASACVLQAFESGFDVTDHKPALVRVSFAGGGGEEIWKRRRCRFDRKALEEPKNMHECDRLFRLCPHVPFAVEPTTHAHIIQTFVCNVLESVCPLTAAVKKRKPYLSEHTYHLVRQSIGVRRGLLKAWTSIRYSGVFVAFGSWRKLAQGRLSGSGSFMWSACWAFARRKDVICVAEAKKWLLQNHAMIHRWCILENMPMSPT